MGNRLLIRHHAHIWGKNYLILQNNDRYIKGSIQIGVLSYFFKVQRKLESSNSNGRVWRIF